MRVGRHEVKISNPEKLFFPERGLTKGDLVQYYLDVAPCALNHIRRRPFHMKRYPHGVEGDFFLNLHHGTVGTDQNVSAMAAHPHLDLIDELTVVRLARIAADGRSLALLVEGFLHRGRKVGALQLFFFLL